MRVRFPSTEKVEYVRFRGVEELVPRLLWEQELNAGSSPVTPTKIWIRGVVGNMSPCHGEDCGFDPHVIRPRNK